MDDFNISDHFNTDGTVNTEGPGLATLAGEEHAESQSYKDVKNLQSFVKAAFDTHAKVGEKLENVIQKPGENATDEEKVAYRKALNAERGAPKTGAEYEFNRVEGLPHDETKEAEFREFCCTNEIPKDTAKAMWDWYHGGQKVLAEANTKAETEAAEQAEQKLREDWAGDKMIENPRLAYAAIQALGPELFADMWEDFKGPSGEMVKGLKTRLTESNVYDAPGDLAKWRECGIDTGQLRHYEVIGRRMLGAKILPGEKTAGAGSDMDEATKARINAENAGSPGMEVK